MKLKITAIAAGVSLVLAMSAAHAQTDQPRGNPDAVTLYNVDAPHILNDWTCVKTCTDGQTSCDSAMMKTMDRCHS